MMMEEIQIDRVAAKGDAAERKVYTVSQLTRLVRFTLEDLFSSVWVEGEISDFTHHSSGHMYFSLKDADANLSCVMFKRENSRLRFKPEAGTKVLLHGRVSIYVPRGAYQLVVDMMEPKGLGALQLAFEQLKNKLLKEGLFDEARKRPLPFLPLSIGVITSPTGAVIRDMMHVWERRFPKVRVILAPVQVQGPQAPGEIVRAIADMNEFGEADVIVVARGGGSLEDLWAFNDEAVARAIAGSCIPVVSAVGHEVDYTIADFVADRRAPTPSAAAEILLPQLDELEASLKDTGTRLAGILRREVESRWDRLERLQASRFFLKPQSLTEDLAQETDALAERLDAAARRRVDDLTREARFLRGQLEAFSPQKCLERGYSIVFDAATGGIIKSTRQLDRSRSVRIRVADGERAARTEGASPTEST
jgi:exodeoxyribonuclease VII large subunit